MEGQYYVSMSGMSTSLADSETDTKALLHHPHHQHGRLHLKGWKSYSRLTSKAFADVALADTEELSSTSAKACDATFSRRWQMLFCWRKLKSIDSVDSSLSSYPIIRETRDFPPPLTTVEYKITEPSVLNSSSSTSPTLPRQTNTVPILQNSADEKCWGHHVGLAEDWGPALPTFSALLANERSPRTQSKTNETTIAFSSPSSSESSGWECPSIETDKELGPCAPFIDASFPCPLSIEISQVGSSTVSKTTSICDPHLMAEQGLPSLVPLNASMKRDTPQMHGKMLHNHSRNHSEPVMSVSALSQDNVHNRPSTKYRPFVTEVSPHFEMPLIRTVVDEIAVKLTDKSNVPLGNPLEDDRVLTLLKEPVSNLPNRAICSINGNQSQGSHVDQDTKELAVERYPDERDLNKIDQGVQLKQIDPWRTNVLIYPPHPPSHDAESQARVDAGVKGAKVASRHASSSVSSAATTISREGTMSVDSQAASHWNPDHIPTAAATPVASIRYAQHLGFLQTLVKDTKLVNHAQGKQ